jgi:hypothetical protein
VIERLTEEELNTLARDIQAGRVFTAAHIRPGEHPSIVGMIWMPLGLGALAYMPEEDRADLGTCYEYLDRAGPIGCNGYPSFFSVQLLGKADTALLGAKLDRLRAAVDAALTGP